MLREHMCVHIIRITSVADGNFIRAHLGAAGPRACLSCEAGWRTPRASTPPTASHRRQRTRAVLPLPRNGLCVVPGRSPVGNATDRSGFTPSPRSSTSCLRDDTAHRVEPHLPARQLSGGEPSHASTARQRWWQRVRAAGPCARDAGASCKLLT